MEHPYKRASLLSKGCYGWLIPYFIKGFKNDLTKTDMYLPLDVHDAGMLGDKLEDAWNYEVINKKNPSLWSALLKVFGVKLIIYSFYFFISEFFIICQPILISMFLKFYEPNQTEMSQNEAYTYAGLLILSVVLIVVWDQNFLFHNMHLAMKIRVAVSSLIYRKALKLNRSALAEATVGQMVNLLSNDVSRFNLATAYLYNLLLAPVAIVVVPYLLYVNVGPTGLVGFGFILLFIPLLMYTAKKNSKYRLKTALRTDERVRLMNEIITGIQVIKMYTWEKPFAKLVENSRRKELQPIRATALLKGFRMSCNLAIHPVGIYLCILTYVLTGNTISAAFAYTVSTFYVYLREILINLFPSALMLLVETNVSVKRIQRFLLLEEVQFSYKANKKKVPTSTENETEDTLSEVCKNNSVGIHINRATVKWTKSLRENSLENITIDVTSPQLVAIVGQVGGGKTTLLHVILKELTPLSGTVDIEGTLSYASQEPWLFVGSVRQNITLGQEFIKKKYEEVVRVCALERDFALLPFGDSTHVGDRGVTLSGGQKARISLARAVYKDADIYLLDDPLSAVDTQVGKQLFDECICGYLKSKLVVLVTHQLQYLSKVQTIYLMQNGKIEMSGSYKQLQESDSKFFKLLANTKEDEREKTDEIFTEHKNVDNKLEAEQEAPSEEKEEMRSGIVSWHVYKSYLVAGGNYFKMVLLAASFIICQITLTATDYFVNIWINLELWRSESAPVNDTVSYDSNESNANNFLESLNLFLTKQVLIIIYSCLIFASIFLTFTRTAYFFKHCMRASKRLHNSMFNKIVHATMRFFNVNPSGRILNRFSKDIGTVDEYLPGILLITVEVGLSVLSTVLIIGSINPWILIPTIVMAIIFYFWRLVYVATSRDIKRVEGVTRSPIYTHLSSSLHGLTTIRAFRAQEILQSQFDTIQNQNSSPYFMSLATNRGFAFWLDMLCAVYITLVVASILFIDDIPGGSVGLALTQSTTLLGTVQWGMRQWSDLENNMTSVERVQQYIEISPEIDQGTRDPPQFWPEKGNLKFENVCLRYSPDEGNVLKNITFEIKPKEKVGIVGRTGAGKSSLIAALFRLTDIEGKITVDDINTKEISLNTLRSKISIIPQEPVLFSGTLRKNLDPFDEYNDDILWSALAEVELKTTVSDLPAGLESKMSEGGSNFSVGQRQLLCLARAIIRNNRILVLDEATANIDPHTDGLIQITIRRKFADCTVLIIAHRLHTIMDSDKVLVMAAGEVTEFDHPHKLLQSPNGVFHGLVMQTGKSMSDNLKFIAQESYKNVSV